MIARAVGVAVLAVLIVSPPLAGQPGEIREPHEWEVTPLVGFRLGSDFALDAPVEEGGPAGNASIGGSVNYGLVVSRRVARNGWVELVWDVQPTRGRLRIPTLTGVETERFDLRVHSLQAGGRVETDAEAARPYASAGIGVTIYDAPGTRGSDTFFGVDAALGAIIDLSDFVAVRLQGRIWLTALGSGTSVWCTPDPDRPRRRCTSSIDQRSVAQADISTGLSIRL